MRVLAIDSAIGRCAVAALVDGTAVQEHQDATRGQPGVLAEMARRILAAIGIPVAGFDAVAVTIGPGSFTGIRGALALAHGLGLAGGIPVIGVTVGEALREALPLLGQRMLWTAVPSRTGRVFIEQDERVLSASLTDLPYPAGPIAVAGTAAHEVASRLAARGANVMLTDARFPSGSHIAEAAIRRLRGSMPPRRAEPLYVDAPEARLPSHPVPTLPAAE